MRLVSAMAQSLRRINPRTSSVQPKSGLNLVTDPAAPRRKPQANSPESPEQRTAKRLRKLHKLQQNIEQLIVLSDTQHCLQAAGETETGGQHGLDAEVQKLMDEISGMVQSGADGDRQSINDTKCLTRHRKGTSRIQLRLSKSLVRILKAFAKAQRRPSVVVEKTMWKDAQIRDAAAILGISLPQASGRAPAK